MVVVATVAVVVAVAVAVTVAVVADVDQSRPHAHSSLAHSFIGVSLISPGTWSAISSATCLLSRLSHARSFGKLPIGDGWYYDIL